MQMLISDLAWTPKLISSGASSSRMNIQDLAFLLGLDLYGNQLMKACAVIFFHSWCRFLAFSLCPRLHLQQGGRYECQLKLYPNILLISLVNLKICWGFQIQNRVLGFIETIFYVSRKNLGGLFIWKVKQFNVNTSGPSGYKPIFYIYKQFEFLNKKVFLRLSNWK